MIFPGRPEATTPRQRRLTPEGADAATPCELCRQPVPGDREPRPKVLERVLEPVARPARGGGGGCLGRGRPQGGV
jgi:hypothetical protein